jgi:hypothetical protein
MGYGLSQGNISANPYQANRTAFVFVFDQNQTKPNTHTLTLTFQDHMVSGPVLKLKPVVKAK